VLRHLYEPVSLVSLSAARAVLSLGYLLSCQKVALAAPFALFSWVNINGRRYRSSSGRRYFPATKVFFWAQERPSVRHARRRRRKIRRFEGAQPLLALLLSGTWGCSSFSRPSTAVPQGVEIWQYPLHDAWIASYPSEIEYRCLTDAYNSINYLQCEALSP
jgi:hypothetical protein